MTDKKEIEVNQQAEVEQKAKTARTKKPAKPTVDIKEAALTSIGYKDVNEECELWQTEYEQFIEAIAVEEPVKMTEPELVEKYPTLQFLKAMTDTTNQEWRCNRYVDLVKESLTDKQIRDYYQFVMIGEKLKDAWSQAAKELDEHLMHKYNLDSKDVGGPVLEEDKGYIPGKFDA
jgi:hypothetical protein